MSHEGVAGAGAAHTIRRVVVVLNPGAGPERGDGVERTVAGWFAEAGCQAEIVVPRGGEGVADRIRRIRGADAVVAGGGDGTINAVAQALAGGGTPLGILPFGTRNHFARSLGLPTDAREAVRVIAAGRARAVDVGEVNGRTFLNNASLGIYPKIVRFREREEQQGVARWRAFGWAILKVLRRHPLVDVHLDVDGRTEVRRTPFLVVSNNRYEVGGFDFGARASLERGVLGLYSLVSPGRAALLRLALHALLGRLHRSGDFDMREACEVRVDTRHRVASLALDGEVVLLETPLVFRSRPGALAVLVGG